MERIPRERLDEATRVPRDEVREGRTYIFDWDPYGWAWEEQDLEGRVEVTADDVHSLTGDIRLVADDGTVLRDLGEGRAQVMGPADRMEGMPDRTDVGRGGRYYEPPGPEEEGKGASGMADEDGPLGPLPGGVADRMSGQ